MGLAICASIAQVLVQLGPRGGCTVGVSGRARLQSARAAQEEEGDHLGGVALPAGWLVLSGVSLRAWDRQRRHLLRNMRRTRHREVRIKSV